MSSDADHGTFVLSDRPHTASLEVAACTILLQGRNSIHLTRDDAGRFTLTVKRGAGFIHLDAEAARSLSADLQAQLFLDEADRQYRQGEVIDHVTPSTAAFIAEDAAREAAWDEAHRDAS